MKWRPLPCFLLVVAWPLTGEVREFFWLLDRFSVPACLDGTVTSWFDRGEPFVVEYPQ